MSDALAIIVAAATAGVPPAGVPIDARLDAAGPPISGPLLDDVSIAIPSLDGFRGITASFERFVPRRSLGLAVSGQLRESATGDYTGVRTGAGAELHWYWRADRHAWLSRQPVGSMTGWFTGGRIELALDATRDRVADRWLDTAFEVGAAGLLGYRIAPWRGLEITPSLDAGWRHEFARRLPGWTRPTAGVGLSVGWMF